VRFFNAIWAVFGGYVIWQAVRGPIERRPLTVIATVLFAGALGRVASLIAEGRPHTIYLVLLGVELCAPALLLLQPRSTER
jgi:hypothetical protein